MVAKVLKDGLVDDVRNYFSDLLIQVPLTKIVDPDFLDHFDNVGKQVWFDTTFVNLLVNVKGEVSVDDYVPVKPSHSSSAM